MHPVAPEDSHRAPRGDGPSPSVSTASSLISPKDSSDLHVHGILAASNRSQSIAIIAVAGLPPTLVRIGDELLDWRVVAIEPDKVQLSRNQKSVSISVDSTSRQSTAVVSPPLHRPSAAFQQGARVDGVPGLD